MPVLLEPETEELPETKTEPRLKRERPRWLARLPWPRGKTRNAAPDDDELIVDNQTFAAWHVYLGYRDLGVLPPQRKLKEQLGRGAKNGLIDVSPLDAPVGTDNLTAYVRPAVHTVEIRSQIINNEPRFDLHLLERAT
jgi:hypothetical protein